MSHCFKFILSLLVVVVFLRLEETSASRKGHRESHQRLNGIYDDEGLLKSAHKSRQHKLHRKPYNVRNHEHEDRDDSEDSSDWPTDDDYDFAETSRDLDDDISPSQQPEEKGQVSKHKMQGRAFALIEIPDDHGKKKHKKKHQHKSKDKKHKKKHTHHHEKHSNTSTTKKHKDDESEEEGTLFRLVKVKEHGHKGSEGEVSESEESSSEESNSKAKNGTEIEETDSSDDPNTKSKATPTGRNDEWNPEGLDYEGTLNGTLVPRVKPGGGGDEPSASGKETAKEDKPDVPENKLKSPSPTDAKKPADKTLLPLNKPKPGNKPPVPQNKPKPGDKPPAPQNNTKPDDKSLLPLNKPNPDNKPPVPVLPNKPKPGDNPLNATSTKKFVKN